MKQVLLHYTSNGYEWLAKEVLMDEFNYRSVIDEYVKEYQPKADALFAKWELEDYPDPLYLDFTMKLDDIKLFTKVDNYIEDNYMN